MGLGAVKAGPSGAPSVAARQPLRACCPGISDSVENAIFRSCSRRCQFIDRDDLSIDQFGPSRGGMAKKGFAVFAVNPFEYNRA